MRGKETNKKGGEVKKVGEGLQGPSVRIFRYATAMMR